jgi:hypothetical protein
MRKDRGWMIWKMKLLFALIIYQKAMPSLPGARDKWFNAGPGKLFAGSGNNGRDCVNPKWFRSCHVGQCTAGPGVE